MSVPESNGHTVRTAAQIRISDSGQFESQPLTWDGEPLYSRDTIAEGLPLFPVAAFEQIPGQLALDSPLGVER
jgi:hypothetical protein